MDEDEVGVGAGDLLALALGESMGRSIDVGTFGQRGTRRAGERHRSLSAIILAATNQPTGLAYKRILAASESRQIGGY